MKTLYTKRLILRAWTLEDAEDLYEYAKDPRVGPNAGWKPHANIQESKEVIKYFLNCDCEYAIVLKDTHKVIGSAGIFNIENKAESSKEIGYVLSQKYWGQGLIPEAVERLKEYGFLDLNLEELWCGHFDFNERSKRVNEKCGFIYQHTQKRILNQLDNKEVLTLMYKINREDFI